VLSNEQFAALHHALQSEINSSYTPMIFVRFSADDELLQRETKRSRIFRTIFSLQFVLELVTSRSYSSLVVICFGIGYNFFVAICFGIGYQPQLFFTRCNLFWNRLQFFRCNLFWNRLPMAVESSDFFPRVTSLFGWMTKQMTVRTELRVASFFIPKSFNI
jgi:hypothetical protein